MWWHKGEREEAFLHQIKTWLLDVERGNRLVMVKRSEKKKTCLSGDLAQRECVPPYMHVARKRWREERNILTRKRCGGRAHVRRDIRYSCNDCLQQGAVVVRGGGNGVNR
jgi:hypothetical protein